MSKKTTTRLALTLLSLSCPLTAIAVEQASPVIVTATRTAQIADQSVAPVIVISRQTLAENPGADVADILRMYTGIEIGRNGGPGQTTSLFLRGTDSSQTLVMINGVKINSGTTAAAALQNIDPSMIDHIEVVLGPRSTLYGSEAIGGVINIITRQRTHDGSDYTAAISGGSHDTRGFRLGAYHRDGHRGAGIQLSYVKSNGIPALSASSINTGYDNLNLHMYGNQRIGKTDYNIDHWQSSGTTHYLDNPTTPLSEYYQNATTAITAKTPVMATWNSTFKISNITDKIDQNQSSDYAHTSRYALDWQNDVQWNSNNLLTSGLYRAQESTSASYSGTSLAANNATSAVFAQNVRTTKLTTLVTGLRFTHDQVYGHSTTWNVEFGWNMTKSLRMTLAGNTGFRAPDFNDLYGYYLYGYSANPTLQPEKSKNREFGLRYLISNSQHLSLNIFHNRITNLIQYDNLTKAEQNIGQATITGSELTYNFTGVHWSARLSASVQNPRNDINNTQLLRRSEHSYSAHVDYHANHYDVGIQAYHSGTRPDIDINTFASTTLAPYTLVNLTGGYHITPHTNLNMRLVNVADAHYQTVDGYNALGRSIYLELRHHFE